VPVGTVMIEPEASLRCAIAGCREPEPGTPTASGALMRVPHAATEAQRPISQTPKQSGVGTWNLSSSESSVRAALSTPSRGSIGTSRRPGCIGAPVAGMPSSGRRSSTTVVRVGRPLRSRWRAQWSHARTGVSIWCAPRSHVQGVMVTSATSFPTVRAPKASATASTPLRWVSRRISDVGDVRGEAEFGSISSSVLGSGVRTLFGPEAPPAG